MGTRSYKPGQYALIQDGSQVLEEHAHKISVDQLIPRIAERNKRAVETVPLNVYFFQAIRAGRRCSCFDIESSPDRQCWACFGTGIVGGYEKYGTTVEVVDITKPSVVSSNVVPDWTMRRKPIPFKLIQGARHGYIKTRVPLTSNTGKVDALKAVYEMPAGTEINAQIRGPGEEEYVTLTKNNVKQRLFGSWLEFRVDMDRQSPAQDSPLLQTVYLRYQNFTDNQVQVNIPRVEKSIALQEIGIADEYSSINFWLDNRLKSITTEDFFMSMEGDTRWKIRTVKDFSPHGQLTSWDIDVRLVQDHESYILVPA